MKQCLFNIDRILGLLMKSRKENEAILVLNALGQKNVEGEGMCIYRQVNPNNFLKYFGLQFHHIEQGMTNDGHVFFKTEKDLEITYSALKEAWFDNQPMFYVKKENINSNKIFYQLDYHKRVNKNAKFFLNGKEAFFQNHFKLLGVNERTGSHIPVGDIFSNGISFPKELANHEIKSHILAYFGI